MMKHLFASCAVVALMAAPALAQSTTEPTDRYAEPTIEDPTTRDPDVMLDMQVQSDTDVMIAAQSETDATTKDELVAEGDAEMAPETDMVAETAAEAVPADEAILEAEASDDTAAIADAQPTFQTQMVDGEAVSAPIELSGLPAEYSTDDLNALMLAQMNQDAEEISSLFNVEVETLASTDARVEASSENDAYAPVDTETDAAVTAEAETYASTEIATEEAPATEMARTETVKPDASVESYASTETSTSMVPEESPVMPETYASVVPVSPALEDDAAEMADETVEMAAADEDMMYAQPDGTIVAAEGDIDQNAVEIAAGDERFSTLVELVGMAGLEDTLSQDGPYTVFAPTNEAFAALPEETLARLKSEEGKPELAEILKAHVVSGVVLAADVPMSGEQAETLAETSLTLMGSTDGSVNVGGTVHTVGDGIYANNGVVYAVDAVILPVAQP